ncbi:MAG TPA: hypothetical protein PLY93_12870, partial [Turneriella sp.]|nr:hypothetical protein [Turneriella sp.]
AILDGPRELRLKIPKDLTRENLKVRIFSTAQQFNYTQQDGVLIVHAIPSKKALSVLEVVYKEDGKEYRANVLLNHKRDKSTAKATKVDNKKSTAKNIVRNKKRKKHNVKRNE